MSADLPERPDMPDDLAQAYAKAHALAGDGRGPAAAVRANVLAAARAVAAEAAARVADERTAPIAATLPLTPVAPPVADVGSGRPRAINLSSWRIRSGAALAAMLLVGLAGWHFDVARRGDGGEQVAMAELRVAAPATTPMPRELPVPPLSGASWPYVPPPVVEEPADAARRPLAKQSYRDKEEVVAQLDQPVDSSARAVPAPAAVAPPRKPPPPAAAPAPVVVADATTSADAPQAKAQASEQDAVTVTIKAAPMQLATAPPRLPSVVPRRVVVPPMPAPVADAAPRRDTVVAAAAAAAPETARQRVEIEAPQAALPGARVSETLKKSAPSSMGSLANIGARVLPTPLHVAADRGDLESLRKLLADPSTPVDAPDAAGRTALLHAVLAQQAAAVRLLLAAGADPARVDQAGLTPRAAAQAGASAEIATLLAAPR